MNVMYLGIDVGGTKTLLATLDDAGVIQEEAKFPTPQSYDDFLGQVLSQIHAFQAKTFQAGGIGIPASELDRINGIGERFGNLPWKHVAVQRDISRLAGCPIVVENDGKLAALSEANLEPAAHKVLCIAIGTGIGIALVVDGVIDTAIGDGGGRTILLERNGKLENWESFASGRAIYQRYGMKASDIEDERIWQAIAHDIALGLIDLIALTEPDLVVIGGGVGTHFHKYGHLLTDYLHHYVDSNPLLEIPRLKGAERAEHAVVYGAYDLAKRLYGPAAQRA